jgi:protein-tyrosine phosphatase
MSDQVIDQRRLPFEGATNFRDLGGYSTAGGGTTRWGLVYRADSLHALTAADVELFERIGAPTVFDLRRDEEREVRPGPFPTVHVCILSQLDNGGQPADRAALVEHEHGEQLLRNLYRGMLSHAGPEFGRMFTMMAEPNGLPAVFHCHAGKDRTGVAAALLLEWLGVDRRTVLDDYVLTLTYRPRSEQESSYQRMLDMGMGPEAASAVLGAPRWAMEETLHDLDEMYGGVEAYLTGPAGMDRSALDRLRHILVEF